MMEAAQWSRADPEDEARDTPTGQKGSEPMESQPSLSGSLTERLTTHQTAAVQAELCEAPGLALTALVHRLAIDVLAEARNLRGSCLKIDARHVRRVPRPADEIALSRAGQTLQATRERRSQALPQDSALWFDALRESPLDQVLSCCLSWSP